MLELLSALGSRRGGAPLLLGFLCAVGCKASVHGEAKAGASGADGEVDAFADFENAPIEDEKGSVGQFAVTPTQSGTDAALLGARHDVFVKADPVENCACLAIVAGPASDPRFGWEAKVPSANAATQLVVAFRMAGCSDVAEGSLGASYRGYVQKGNDVVVMVEEAMPGRPLIVGAIVPRPTNGGQLLLESVPGKLPYAKPLDGTQSRCSVEF